MQTRQRLLWLPGWLPSKVDFLSGDFILRHAVAISACYDIDILFATKDETLNPGSFNIEIETLQGLTIYRGYYNNTKIKPFKKIHSAWLYYKLLWKMYKKINAHNYTLAHVHVVLKQGLFAIYLKRKFNLNYVITEQNTAFVPIGNKRTNDNSISRLITRNVYKNATALHTVSEYLGKCLMKQFSFIKTFTVIPNVVDTSIFNMDAKKEFDQTTFFAITGDNFQKNTEAVIKAFHLFNSNGGKAKLVLAGPGTYELINLIEALHLKEHVESTGPVAYEQIAYLMKQSHAFIFFTRYETFGCVAVEALCSGTPVIASDIEVLHENLTENINALFAKPDDVNDLCRKMEEFVQKQHSFNSTSIAQNAAAKYTYNEVAQQFVAFYNKALIK